eukprot:10883357-Ditylum_brightwellii.AAC.2
MFGSVFDVIPPSHTKRLSHDQSTNTELMFDLSDPVVDELAFQQRDWTSSEFGHAQGKEEILSNFPE